MENETNQQDEQLNVAGTASPLKAENLVIRRTMREQAFEKYPVRPQSAPVDIPSRTLKSAESVRQAHYWGSPTPHNTPEETRMPNLSPLSDVSERSEQNFQQVMENFRSLSTIATGGKAFNWLPLSEIVHTPLPKSQSLSPNLSPKSK